jgi:hypothetical protein
VKQIESHIQTPSTVTQTRDNIKLDRKESEFEGVEKIQMAQVGATIGFSRGHFLMKLISPKMELQDDTA